MAETAKFPTPMPRPLQTDEETIGLRAIWLTLRQRWRLIVSLTLFALALTAVILLLMTPRYTSEAKLVIEPPKVSIGLEELLSNLNIDQEEINTEIEIIRSRKVIGRVVDKLRLMRDPEFNAELRELPWTEALNPLNWLPEAWRTALLGEPEALSPEERERRLKVSVVDAVRDRLDVSRVGLSRVIQVAFTSEDSKKAARIANAIAESYLEEQIESRFESTSRVARWLQERLKELKNQVIAAEKAVALYKAQHGLTEAESATLIEQQLAELNSKYILAKADLAEAEAQLQQVKRLLQEGGAIHAAKVLNFPLIQRLVEQEAEVVRKVAELSERYGPRHPKMIEANAELASIRKKIEREVRKVIQSLKNEAEVARARVRSLRQALARLEGRRHSQSQAEVKLKELEREAEAVRTVYETFLSRFKELSEQGQLQQTEARIIAWAEVPTKPSFPRKKLTLALVGVMSLFGGGALALLLETLIRGFRDERQLELWTGRPVVTSLPEIKKGSDRLPDLLIDHPSSPYSEGVRRLRTAVTGQVVLVTSTVPEEGKSTVALSLARAYALSGLRVLLLDCDLRKPEITKFLGGKDLPLAYDMVEVLQNPELSSQAMVIDPKVASLNILPGRTHRSLNPTDLLEQAQLDALLEALRNRFDRIVIDTAPFGLFPDTQLFLPHIDGVVYLIRYRETPREAVVRALEKVSGVEAVNLVLNRVDWEKEGYSYYYGYHYYQRYGYES